MARGPGLDVLIPFTSDGPDGPGLFGGAELAAGGLLVRRAGVYDPTVVFAAALAVWAHRSGHSCIDLDVVGELLTEDARRKGVDGELPPLPADPDGMVAALTAATAVVRVVDEPPDVADALADNRPLILWGRRLTSHRQFTDECSIAERLAVLVRAPVVELSSSAQASSLLGQQLQPAGDDDAQMQAALAVLDGGVTVLTGGPGTGKTHTLTRALLAYLVAASEEGSMPSVAVCAPSGKAARRAGELLAEVADDDAVRQVVGPAVAEYLAGLRPTTIHGLLRPHRGSLNRFVHNADNPLPHDFVIVDETSMVPVQLMARLLEALRPPSDDRPATRLLLVGDGAQLESVESGSVLRDLVSGVSLLDGRVHELRRIRRVTGGSRIVDAAPLIRSGSPTDAKSALDLFVTGARGLSFVDLDPGQSPTLADLGDVVDHFVTIAEHARTLDPDRHAEALGQLAGIRVLCGARRGPRGIATVNALLSDHLGLNQFGAAQPGKVVLVTANAPRVDLDNGDVGLVVRHPDGIRVCFGRADELRYLTPAQLPPHEPAWAMTVHKSQGSEYGDEVVLVLPDMGSPLLTRELLYTAVTRAKDRVRVVGGQDAFIEAVQRPSLRSSGLAAMLNVIPATHDD